MLKKLQKNGRSAIVAFGLLCSALVGSAQNPADIKRATKTAKVSSDLLNVINNNGIPNQAPSGGVQRTNLYLVSGNTIAIDAVVNEGQAPQALLQSLQALGLRNGIISAKRVSGYLPIDKLNALKDVAALKYARPAYRPIHNVGSVTSQGDAAMRADVARTTYSVTGAGVKVGILSDSYNSLGGASAGIASGDLPAEGVEVLEDLIDPNNIDEGRAMAELVHDVAPGSPLAFHTAFTGDLEFAQGIRDLAAAGCKIITDDVSYFAEPFFQDGPIAQAIDDVVNNNQVTYFSSAGNSGRSSYQSPYRSTSFSDVQYDPSASYTAHDFSNGDKFQSITLGPGRQIIISFQWDDPFFSVSGGDGAQTDMDLLVYVNGSLQGGLSSFDSNIGADPVEIIGVTNNGSSTASIELVLVKYEGPDPTLVKWVNFGSTVPIEYDTKSSTSVGHSNSSRCIAVGAAPFFNTPAFNANLTTATIEPFSSAGGTPILFSVNGQRLSQPVVRQKPEITAVDGTNTTFFIADSPSDPDTFPNFFGTSAAAPHAAAVAALMQEKGNNALAPSTILTALEETALDMDDPSTAGFDTGFDFGTGYGFIQADRAIQAITPVTPPSGFAITGVTTVSCATVTAGLRTITFTPVYTGLSGEPVSFSVVNELLPTTSPGPYTLNLYTDNPIIILKAQQAGTEGEVSFGYNWLAACEGGSTPTPPSGFAITGVTTVSCETVTAGLRTVTFTPVYTGLSGEPVSFSVVNELLPTTSPGPYTLNLYTDNPVITLKAVQAGSETSFAYNWLAACTSGSARLSAGINAELSTKLDVRVLGNPINNDQVSVEVRGAGEQLLQLNLTDAQGRLLETRRVDKAGSVEVHTFEVGRRSVGTLLLRATTATETQTIKLIKSN
ncbi:S8 family peptidase [Spirosoma utsteinense]|uniref:Peptidase S8/S53 domain-containing protein n=1 Tax=Spirosoma utsteinense TaxID=2585773 RepID=A0ABR6W3P1_9BACT|nr:S8 family serine peptidase [Spirosoma utsteinense]MBC3784444.1 hypothetical protein [Spirosoma utsteinense]MBC3790753.1 hypothetical protein [Spirosoma utsteinense]